jgi:antitoxin CptB
METLRKRLLYKATHRGTQESDRLIGGFAALKLPDLSDQLLLQFDVLLDVSDVDLLNWILAREAIPDAYNNEVIKLLIQFRKDL